MYAFSLFITLHRPRIGTILIHSADSPDFPCLATEIIWCCQGIFMEAMEVNNLLLASRRFFFFCRIFLQLTYQNYQFYHYLGFVCLPKDPNHQIPLLPNGEHM